MPLAKVLGIHVPKAESIADRTAKIGSPISSNVDKDTDTTRISKVKGLHFSIGVSSVVTRYPSDLSRTSFVSASNNITYPPSLLG